MNIKLPTCLGYARQGVGMIIAWVDLVRTGQVLIGN